VVGYGDVDSVHMTQKGLQKPFCSMELAETLLALLWAIGLFPLQAWSKEMWPSSIVR
jgi:hypothetical protein